MTYDVGVLQASCIVRLLARSKQIRLYNNKLKLLFYYIEML